MKKITTRISFFIMIVMLFTLTSCKEKYQVIFNLDGGIADYTQVEVKKGETITEPAPPTKEGYIFKGFEVNGKQFDFSTPIEHSMTLTAKWSKLCEIKFMDGNQILDTKKIEENQKVAKPEDLKKDNATFLGWYLDDEEYNFNTVVTGDITLVAKWKQDYKVTIHLNNGEADLVFYAKDNQKLYEFIPQTNPKYDGYEFLNYCLDEELTIQIYDYYKKVTSDIDLYVLWSEYYTITYHLDGGVCEDLIEKYSQNDTYYTAFKLKTPKKEGYYFRGYYLESDFSGNRFYEVSKGQCEDLELYAKWEEATLENAYIGFVGDSITTYKGYVPNGYAYFPYDTFFPVNKTWWKMTQEALGCKLGINNSYSGTCVLKRYGNGSNSGETMARLEKCKRADQIDPDILVVYMGMNDCLVDPKDVTVAEFEKSYENMINNIYKLYPDVKLFVCTLSYDVNYQNKPNLDAHLTQKENFNQVIRKIANNHQIPIIDFASAFTSSEYLLDTVHPNALGMVELSKLAVEEIKKFFAK